MANDNVLMLIGIAALGLAGYNFIQGHTAQASGASGHVKGNYPVNTNSESYPYPPGASETGQPSDTPARVGYGETPQENLFAEIPPERISMVGGDSSWYERRHISEKLSWTPEQYLKGWHTVIGEKFGGTGAGIPGSELSAKALYAYGYSPTMEHAQGQITRNQMIAQLGGSWQGGVLTPPADFKGSVTEFSDLVREKLRGTQ